MYLLLQSTLLIDSELSWCVVTGVHISITVLCFITGLLLLTLHPKWSQICDRPQTGSECAVNSSQSCRSLYPLQTVLSVLPEASDKRRVFDTEYHYTTVTHTPDTLLVEKWLLRDKNRGQVITRVNDQHTPQLTPIRQIAKTINTSNGVCECKHCVICIKDIVCYWLHLFTSCHSKSIWQCNLPLMQVN